MGFTYYADYDSRMNGAKGKRRLKTYMASCQEAGRRRVRFSLETKDEKVARQRISKVERDYANGVSSPWDRRPRYGKMLANDAITDFLRWAGRDRHPWKPKTAKNYREVLDGFAATLSAGLTIDLIDAVHVRKFVERPELARPSSHNYLRHIRSFFRWCSAEGLVPSDPTRGVKLPPEVKGPPIYMSRAEVDRLLAHLKEKATVERHAFTRRRAAWLLPIVQFAVATGMRAGEVLALEWGDIDFESGFIHVRRSLEVDTKTYMTRSLSLVGQTRQALDHVKGDGIPKDRDIVFKSIKGRVCSVNQLSKAFRGYRKNVALKAEYHLHTLRHSFASWLVMDGTPIFTVKELMGHVDINVTLRYAHLAPEAHRKDLERTFGDLTAYFGVADL